MDSAEDTLREEVSALRRYLNDEARNRRREVKGRLAAEAVIARATYYLKRGDSAAALKELLSLPKGPPKEPDGT